MASSFENTIKSIPSAVKNATMDLLASSDFVNRSIGMSNSYNDIMFILQSLGRKPVSLLGKDYMFIFDHVRRNYRNGTVIASEGYNYIDCPKFTFYKEVPTVRFADIDNDILTYDGDWIPNMEFNTTSKSRTEYFYAESQKDGYIENRSVNPKYSSNAGVAHGALTRSFDEIKSCDIVSKTNAMFNAGRYRTLISRFHTGNDAATRQDDITQTAISAQYGMSHGRNLLKPKKTVENGYDNPYCRVWTHHHQYHTMEDAIRPFGNMGWGVGVHKELESAEGGSDNVSFRTRNIGTTSDGGFYGGSEALDKYGVLNSNGFVNIAPTTKIDNYFEGVTDDDNRGLVSPKKTMFSIENLAWKEIKDLGQKEYDEEGLSPEQRGPFGGRIMWFPPYNLKFNENVNVNWNSNEFIGRGEKIYTYTNTERSGNLSFTLLIDHPSIVDYWNRNSVTYVGDTSGVDEVDNEENTLLRFYAGCDVLQASPQKYKKLIAKPNSPTLVGASEEKPKDENNLVLNDSENQDAAKKYDEAIVCVLYYPNNYSGVDDMPNNGGTVNAVDYLMNGIGTQKYINETTKEAIDLSVSKARLTVNGSSSFGGYEVRNGGISFVSDMLSSGSIPSSYASETTQAQYLTTSNGGKVTAKYGSNNAVYLAKQIGDKAPSLESAKDPSIASGTNYEWYARKWYYRVDEDTVNQKLRGVPVGSVTPMNYIDYKSYKLNSTGYESIKSVNEIVKTFGIDDENKMKLVSFTDMYVALENNSLVDNMLDGLYSSDNVAKIRDIKNYKIVDIKFYGHASSQGNNPSESVNETRNNDLARQRGETFKAWLKGKLSSNVLDDAVVDFAYGVQKNGVTGDTNDKETKMWRSASVVIKLAKVDVENAQDTNPNEMEVETDGTRNVVVNKVQKYTTLDSEQYKVFDEFMKNKSKEAYEGALAEITSAWSKKSEDNVEKSTYEENVVQRYDNEGEFFKLLAKNDPFLHHLVSEKVKYFDPAYHSISPEGFNARLTFLHQCTRQGSTVGNSDINNGNAYNLAFGRPPVCVLRIGDFYYTKIVITSLNIQYDSPQWDMNPEGIGVMPMYADININFNFLGGSDLSGPIARLQNAVSFNYYANTSVYDNRSEKVNYDKNGNETNFKPFVYPNTER